MRARRHCLIAGGSGQSASCPFKKRKDLHTQGGGGGEPRRFAAPHTRERPWGGVRRNLGADARAWAEPDDRTALWAPRRSAPRRRRTDARRRERRPRRGRCIRTTRRAPKIAFHRRQAGCSSRAGRGVHAPPQSAGWRRQGGAPIARRATTTRDPPAVGDRARVSKRAARRNRAFRASALNCSVSSVSSARRRPAPAEQTARRRRCVGGGGGRRLRLEDRDEDDPRHMRATVTIRYERDESRRRDAHL